MDLKTFKYLIIFLILLLPSQYLLLASPIFPSHDGLYHIARIDQFHQSIDLGQVPPRLAPTILNGIGYPLFVVNYQLPYYLAEIFMQISNNSTLAFKSVLSVTFLLSGIFAFFLFKNISSNIASLTGALVFSYLPYRFANLYSRASLGESTAVLFSVMFLFSLHLIIKNKGIGFFLLAIATFGLVTSHPVIFFIFIPFYFLYFVFIMKPGIKTIKIIILSVLLGILMSSFQWMPAVFEKNFLKFDQNLLELYKGHFLNIFQILRIPGEGVNIGTPFQIGITSSIIFVFSLALWIKKRNTDTTLLISVFLVSIFLIHPSSRLLWENIKPLDYVLYPWRFLSIALISSAFLSVHLINEVKHKKLLVIFIIALAIYPSRHYFIKPNQVVHSIPTPTLTTQNEFDTIWTNNKTYSQRPLIDHSNQVEIMNVKSNPYRISFDAKLNQDDNLIVRKLYFPGWNVKVDGKKHSFYQEDGLISFNLAPGKRSVDVFFEESPVRKIANFSTLTSTLVSLILVAFRKRIFQ